MYIKNLALAMILTSAALTAQEQTLLSRNMTHGGYGSWGVHVSQLNGETAYLSTSRLVWLINHSYSLGLGGYDLIGSVDGPLTLDSESRFINLDLGGVELGYIFAPNSVIHGSIRVLGSLGQVEYHNDNLDDPWQGEEDFVAAIVPSVDLMVNVTSFIHMGINASYRIVNGVDLDGLTNADLSGPSLGAVIQFGKF
jgi:hypothetical protein